MNDNELDAKQIEQKVHELHRSMEKVKTAQASRDDVVVEMEQAARARLELLAKDLQPVFNDLPDDVDWFEFGLANGEPPRLWIDLTTHVRMGRDRRVYELVKDTRLGRTILFQNEDKNQMGEAVTDYVAGRMLEREREIEGEWIDFRNYRFEEARTPKAKAREVTRTETRKSSNGILWFIIGLVAATIAILAWGWYGDAPGLRALMENWLAALSE